MSGPAALAAVLAVSACAPPADERPRPETVDVAHAHAHAHAHAQAPAPLPGHSDEDEDLPAAEPYPTWDAAARVDATETATVAMAAFARPALDEAAWWAALQPLLSPAGAAAYAGTDPAAVPARAVTGAGTLTDDSSTYLAPVAVPTDVGAYLVLLSRRAQGSPWLVERFTPPQTVTHS